VEYVYGADGRLVGAKLWFELVEKNF